MKRGEEWGDDGKREGDKGEWEGWTLPQVCYPSRSERPSTLNSSPPFCCPSLHYAPLLQGSHYGRLRTEPICLWDGLKRGTSPMWKRKGERAGWDKGEGELEAVKYRVEISLQREVRSNRTLEHTAWGSRLLLLLQMVWRRLQRTDFSLCIWIYVSHSREGISEHACSSTLSSSDVKENAMFSG